MSTDPDPDPTAADNDGTAEPTILGTGEFIGGVLKGDLDPSEWEET